MKKQKIKKMNISSYILIEHFLIIIISFQIFLSQTTPNITMKIKGEGTIYLFSQESYCEYKGEYPNKINLDGEDIFDIKKSVKVNEMKIHEIKMYWNKKVNTSHNMFCLNRAIIELDLSHFDTSEVTSMSWMFYGCSALTSINLNNINFKSVQEMGLMFYDCSNLTSLNLSNLDFPSLQSMYGMFLGCSNLEFIDLSNINLPSLNTMEYMFH